MTDPPHMTDVKIGALIWNQYTEWKPFRDFAVRADELGVHSLWTWDHEDPDCEARTCVDSRAAQPTPDLRTIDAWIPRL